jgi:hypothetical protein
MSSTLLFRKTNCPSAMANQEMMLLGQKAGSLMWWLFAGGGTSSFSMLL